MRAAGWWWAREAVNDSLANCREAGLRWWSEEVFFPPRLSEAAGLQEDVGHQCHQRMAMETGPGTAFEVIEAEFFLELLMRLLADPACLDRTGQVLDWRVCWQV